METPGRSQSTDCLLTCLPHHFPMFISVGTSAGPAMQWCHDQGNEMHWPGQWCHDQGNDAMTRAMMPWPGQWCDDQGRSGIGMTQLLEYSITINLDPEYSITNWKIVFQCVAVGLNSDNMKSKHLNNSAMRLRNSINRLHMLWRISSNKNLQT